MLSPLNDSTISFQSNCRHGRVGRLLTTFLLHAGGALRQPILYLSLYFKEHRQTYYELLNRVREKGDWETWLEFFLTAVKETSEKAVLTARRMLALFEEDRRKIETLKRPASSALRVFQFAQTSPMLSIATTSTKLGVSFPTVSKSIDHLMKLEILQKITGKQSGRLFLYKSYLSILSEAPNRSAWWPRRCAFFLGLARILIDEIPSLSGTGRRWRFCRDVPSITRMRLRGAHAERSHAEYP